MHKMIFKADLSTKIPYVSPVCDIILISGMDVITTSGDDNQGEWDPQNVNLTI